MLEPESRPELFPYQVIGAKWLASKKVGLLADEMGLGKSAQTIVAADSIGANRILIICPAIARINWEREFAKFSTRQRKFQVLFNSSVAPSRDHSIICSYDLASVFGKQNRWKDHFFDALIIDEAHYLKSLTALRTKAIMGKTGLVRQANRVWALTGTPMPSHPGELWVLLYSFCQTQLKYPAFIERFCEFPYGRGPGSGMMQISGAKSSMIPELKALLAPIMLRRKKENVLKELPPLMLTDVTVEPGEVDLVQKGFAHFLFPHDRRRELEEQINDERKLLETALKQTGYGVDGMKMLEALAGSVSTLRRYIGLQKVPVVTDMLRYELDAGYYKKIVVFCIHRDVIENLRRGLAKKYGAVTVYGETDPQTRQKNVDSFQNNPRCRVFIGNIHAAGTAITLTAADQVLMVEQDWVPGNNAQAIMRVHRIGQTRTVTVRFVGLMNSLDEKVANILKRKTRDIIEIFDNGPKK